MTYINSIIEALCLKSDAVDPTESESDLLTTFGTIFAPEIQEKE